MEFEEAEGFVAQPRLNVNIMLYSNHGNGSYIIINYSDLAYNIDVVKQTIGWTYNSNKLTI